MKVLDKKCPCQTFIPRVRNFLVWQGVFASEAQSQPQRNLPKLKDEVPAAQDCALGQGLGLVVHIHRNLGIQTLNRNSLVTVGRESCYRDHPPSVVVGYIVVTADLCLFCGCGQIRENQQQKGNKSCSPHSPSYKMLNFNISKKRCQSLVLPGVLW